MKKIVSLLLVFAISFSIIAGLTVTSNAATSHTQSEAVSWAKSKVGVKTGDGQCVALIKAYYTYLGVSSVTGNGCDYATNSLPSGWSRIKYYSGFSAQPGDIAVWTWNKWAENYGHVAIVTSANSSSMSYIDQGKTYGYVGHSGSLAYNAANWTFYGVIRPDFKANVDVTTPTLSFNKGSYLVGETAKITWTASSSNSNLKHYWLVITNKTTGKQYYGSSVGTNSYSLKLTEAGIIKVDVYAIRNDGSGLSNSKSFNVSSVDVSTPTLSFDKGSYLIGETAKITWTASSSKSDLKYYWLVINNTTTGNKYHAASVSTNSYSLKVTEAGTIKVDVYAIRNDGSGLSDSKTFNVSYVDISKPTLSFDKGSYLVGETAKITWTASSSKSDLKYYWLVINNTTTGNKYHAASVGTNSYSLKLTEAGTIKVDVYAIRNDGSGLSDSKTFTVTQNCSHTYTSTVTKSATCTTAGTRKYTCSKCGYYYTSSIAALGHNMVKKISPATVNNNGTSYTGYITKSCTRCSAFESEHIVAVDIVKLSTERYVYNSAVKTPSVKVVDFDGKVLKKGTDYTLTYASGRKNVGKYAVKVNFKGNYTGSRTLYFKILPKGTALSKLTAGKKSFTVKWKKQATQTSGYQLQYSTNASYSGAKAVAIKSPNAVSKTIKGLASKRYYYVRIRTYKTVGGVNHFSGWSKSLKVKTK